MLFRKTAPPLPPSQPCAPTNAELLCELYDTHRDLLAGAALEDRARIEAASVVNTLTMYTDHANDQQLTDAIREALINVHTALVAHDGEHALEWLRLARGWRDNAAIRWRVLHGELEGEQS